MQSKNTCAYTVPPSATYKVIPTAGQHTVLKRNYSVYRDAMRNVDSRGLPVNLNITNDTGTNNQAVNFEQTFLIPNATCTTINTTGLPRPWSLIEKSFEQSKPSDHLDFLIKGGLGPLVLNLGPLR
jgi:hypothetical protein